MPETTDQQEQPPIEELLGSLMIRVGQLEETTEQLGQALLELTTGEELPQVQQALKDHSGPWVMSDSPHDPTPGRIVLYHNGVQTFAAIVTDVYVSGAVKLVVFGMGQPAAIRDSVMQGDEGCCQQNRWTWPPRMHAVADVQGEEAGDE